MRQARVPELLSAHVNMCPFSARTCTRQPVAIQVHPIIFRGPLCDEGCGAREAISIRPVDYGKKRWKKDGARCRHEPDHRSTVAAAGKVIQPVGEAHPRMSRFFPYRSHGRGEMRVVECADSDPYHSRVAFRFPVEAGSAVRAEVSLKFPSRICQTTEQLAWTEDTNARTGIVRADSEHGTGAALALTAVARNHGSGIPISLDPKRSTATLCDSIHDAEATRAGQS